MRRCLIFTVGLLPLLPGAVQADSRPPDPPFPDVVEVGPVRLVRQGQGTLRYKRVIPVYDGINDVSKWRLGLLYGRKLIDPRLATRLSGTA